MSETKKIQVAAVLILLTCFIQFYLSPNLWLPINRDFPLIPFFEFLPLRLNHVLRILLISSMGLALILAVVFPKQKKVLLLFSVPAILFVLEDAMRLQPWFYMHIIMISLIAFEKKITQPNVLRFLQFILIAIYFWGGFNKLNIAFTWEVFPWLIEPTGFGEFYYLGFDNLNSFPLPVANYIAFVIPIVEIAIAIFLFIPRFRNFGLILCIFTHLFSLYSIGPLGQNWNIVVWPWNILMPILCWLLFYGDREENYLQKYRQALKSKVGMLILFLFLAVPTLSFFGKWDKGMAMHLYSGNSSQMEFHFEGFQEQLVNSSFAPYLSLDTVTMTSFMKVRYWADAQLGTPMYSELRYLKKVGAYLCNCLENTNNSGIQIINRNGFYSTQDTLKISCEDLIYQ